MESTASKVQQRLETDYGFKLQRNGEWRGNCTWKPNSNGDSNSMWVKFEDAEHGMWKYFAGDEGGSLYDLAKELDIELPHDGRVSVQDSKRAYSDFEDYAKAHYVPVEVFQKAGWKSTTHRDRLALTFPVQTGTRVRYLDAKGGFSWVTKDGSNCWYGLARAISIANSAGLPLILCNGEASTVVAQAAGLPAFSSTAGEGAATDGMLADLHSRWSGAVIIAQDCDEAGRKAAATLQPQVKRSTTIDLGLGNKGDLADFCGLHEGTSMAALRRLAKLTPAAQKEQAVGMIEFVSLDSALAQVSKFAWENPALMGRVIRMPFASLRKHGGFAEIMTTKKVWLIGNTSGGGKTMWSETVCDELTTNGHNVFYIGDEWSPMELAARTIQRAFVGENVITYMDYLRHAQGSQAFSDAQCMDISATIRVIRERRGRSFYMQVSDAAVQVSNGVTYLEDILQAVRQKVHNLRANNVEVDVILLDYLSLYPTRENAGNVEEYKIGLLKSLCQTIDVLGISTVQVNKNVEEKIKDRGGLLTERDLYYVRPDKANLITMMNRVYLNNYSAQLGNDMSHKEAVELYKDANGQIVPTPNLIIQTAKNSVDSPGNFSYFHFDYSRMRIREGLHADFVYNPQYKAVMSRSAFPSAERVVNLENLG